MEYSTYGRHIALDVWGVDFSLLDDVEFLKQGMIDAAVKSRADVLSVTYKKFEPNGCTVLILVSESHLSIHTYPEEKFAAIDCFTCGKKVDPQIAINYLIDILKPKKMYMKKLIRGLDEIVIID
ncbi:adenosylmethionine decarboxylase [Paenibacillus prosopidis]|uniref:S-adenosylmethionine decarboxylase proenzyme n=1 Tax=Paenibacillus prosopidis TaxID=630520 RepID=A0A368W029_9BACL|nr:adenosylmethionine decarboxylase [Paenibacillus prosopidis]RCW48031.1 adenosylmethionine decarboxylase proenzyme [Paenibacillus prosopidis]